MSNTNKERCISCGHSKDNHPYRHPFKSEDAVPSQVEHKVFGKVHEVEDTQPSGEWESRFDDKRNELHHVYTEGGENSETVEFGYKTQRGNEVFTVTDWGNIKKFIRSLLLTQRSKLVGEIESMIMVNLEMKPKWWRGFSDNRFLRDLDQRTEGFNIAIKKVVAHLKSNLK